MVYASSLLAFNAVFVYIHSVCVSFCHLISVCVCGGGVHWLPVFLLITGYHEMYRHKFLETLE